MQSWNENLDILGESTVSIRRSVLFQNAFLLSNFMNAHFPHSASRALILPHSVVFTASHPGAATSKSTPLQTMYALEYLIGFHGISIIKKRDTCVHT